MKKNIFLIVSVALSVSLIGMPTDDFEKDVTDHRGKMAPWEKGAWETGEYRNVFLEAGYKQEEIDAKLAKAYSDLFEGPNRVYFEVGDSMAYVSDLKNHDARTDGHPRDEAQNSVYYLRYEKGKFVKANGDRVGSMSELPIQHKSSDLVYDGSSETGRAWVWDIAIDNQGHPVIAYTRLPAETDHRYCYARWTGERWLDVEITPGGKWFPQTPEGHTEPKPHYSGGMRLTTPIHPHCMCQDRLAGFLRLSNGAVLTRARHGLPARLLRSPITTI
ncbi:BNR-4 repeat-containing protein [candidate division KSB1 bacterium]|nr:BNR-4 repeat-containing protein [candidate division KSB1 bacterium]